MASLKKRGNVWYVIYRYKNEEGVSIPKWEAVGTRKDALARKAEVENQQIKILLLFLKMKHWKNF